MNAVSSIAINSLVTFTAVAIGWSTEVRAIIDTRTRLARACASDGTDERLAFELADVDRGGIERRLIMAGGRAALALIAAFYPARVLARHLANEFGWSIDLRLVVGALLGLVGPTLWSAVQVRRTASPSATI